jgi:inosose dehydratase
MKRRQLLGALGGAGAAVLGMRRLGPLARADEAPRLRWAFGWILWRDFTPRKIPLTEAVADLQAVGADGIELTLRPGELEAQGLTLKSTRALLDEAGLAVSAHYFSAPFYDGSRRKEIEDGLKEKLASLAVLGGKQIVIGPPAPPPGQEHPAVIRAMAPVLDDLGRRAGDAGVKVGIHPHLNTVIETPEEIDIAMEATDPRLVSLAADTGHIYLAGGDVVSILRKYASRLCYFHFKDGVRPFHRPDFLPNMRELGAGEVDFPGVMRLLAEIGYRGWINVEQDHTTLTPRESCVRSMKYVESTLKPLYD